MSFVPSRVPCSAMQPMCTTLSLRAAVVASRLGLLPLVMHTHITSFLTYHDFPAWYTLSRQFSRILFHFQEGCRVVGADVLVGIFGKDGAHARVNQTSIAHQMKRCLRRQFCVTSPYQGKLLGAVYAHSLAESFRLYWREKCCTRLVRLAHIPSAWYCAQLTFVSPHVRPACTFHVHSAYVLGEDLQQHCHDVPFGVQLIGVDARNGHTLDLGIFAWSRRVLVYAHQSRNADTAHAPRAQQESCARRVSHRPLGQAHARIVWLGMQHDLSAMGMDFHIHAEVCETEGPRSPTRGRTIQIHCLSYTLTAHHTARTSMSPRVSAKVLFAALEAAFDST
jgi:hypothetical protein